LPTIVFLHCFDPPNLVISSLQCVCLHLVKRPETNLAFKICQEKQNSFCFEVRLVFGELYHSNIFKSQILQASTIPATPKFAKRRLSDKFHRTIFCTKFKESPLLHLIGTTGVEIYSSGTTSHPSIAFPKNNSAQNPVLGAGLIIS